MKTKIDGKRWFDLGSDLNWITHGGTWGRPCDEDPDLWYVIQFFHDGSACGAIVHEIRISDDHNQAMRMCGLRRDEEGWHYTDGTAIPYDVLPREIAYCAASYGSGRVASVNGRHPYHVRATAARYLLGDFITGEHGRDHVFGN